MSLHLSLRVSNITGCPNTKVPILKEYHFEEMKLWRVEHFWTYLSSFLGVITEYNSNNYSVSKTNAGLKLMCNGGIFKEFLSTYIFDK